MLKDKELNRKSNARVNKNCRKRKIYEKITLIESKILE